MPNERDAYEEAIRDAHTFTGTMLARELAPNGVVFGTYVPRPTPQELAAALLLRAESNANAASQPILKCVLCSHAKHPGKFCPTCNCPK